MGNQRRKECPDLELLRRLAKTSTVYALRKRFNVDSSTMVRWLDWHEIAAIRFEPIRGVQRRLMAQLPVPDGTKWCVMCRNEIKRGECCRRKWCRDEYEIRSTKQAISAIKHELREHHRT